MTARAGRLRRCGLALACLGAGAGCDDRSDDAKTAASAEVMRAPVCEPKGKHAWVSLPPRADDETVYGVGSGSEPAAARHAARKQAAETVEVHVRSETSTQLVDWARSTAEGKQGGVDKRFESSTLALVDRVLQGCRFEQTCRDGSNRLWVLAACHKQTELERELAKALEKAARALPEGAVLLLVPGTDEDGWITGLGEYAAQMVRARIDRVLPASARLVRVPKWVPADLHEIARQHKATHLLRIEHASAGEHRARFTLWIQDTHSDQQLAGSSAGFEVAIAPGQLELLILKGPLLPQKAAMDLAANLGAGRVDLQVSSTHLREGDNVEIVFRIEKDGYVYLFNLYEDGQAVMLVPSPDLPGNHHPAGEHRIPNDSWKQKGHVLKACPMPGRRLTRENVKIIVAPQQLPLIDAVAAAGGMQVFTVGPKGDLSALVKKLNAIKSSGATFSDATVPYFIEAMPGANSGCPK